MGQEEVGGTRGGGWGKRRWVGQEEVGGFTQSVSKAGCVWGWL